VIIPPTNHIWYVFLNNQFDAMNHMLHWSLLLFDVCIREVLQLTSIACYRPYIVYIWHIPHISILIVVLWKNCYKLYHVQDHILAPNHQVVCSHRKLTFHILHIKGLVKKRSWLTWHQATPYALGHNKSWHGWSRSEQTIHSKVVGGFTVVKAPKVLCALYVIFYNVCSRKLA
jgi:hypothetical protein